MEKKKGIITILAVFSVAIVLTTIFVVQGLTSFSVEYQPLEGCVYPWRPHYTVNDTEATFFVQNMEEWNDYFIIPDTYSPINYTENPYALPEWMPDFDNYSYAILDWGMKPTGGYSIEFQSVTYKSGAIEFRYVKHVPEGTVTMALTFPNSIIQIPKSQFADHEITGYRFILIE
ncbi:MAG: protease complex subunit PrcB family protein [Thermoplasmata archaeon]|nr:protease complex subunit PrcB family protein [Thermoplasmata archaeon]